MSENKNKIPTKNTMELERENEKLKKKLKNWYEWGKMYGRFSCIKCGEIGGTGGWCWEYDSINPEDVDEICEDCLGDE
jgi:hypothetical protein